MFTHSNSQKSEMRVCVVIPCFKVTGHIISVLDAIGEGVERIFVVDDCCPDNSGDYVTKNSRDPRVVVLRHDVNKGVGGAVVTGYRAALSEGFDIAVKIDGDGQMDPTILPRFVAPIMAGEADYAKGNRFFSAAAIRGMPPTRLLGNAILSFMTKLSSGYWSVFDPTNGYTAIHARALAALNRNALSERYFFETDMLIRLGDLRAVVVDVPMRAVYADEVSGLKVSRILREFLTKHVKATVRRIVYLYILRDFNFASLNLLFGLVAFAFGTIFGAIEWIVSLRYGVPATAGTVMLSVMPIIIGLQMLLFFFSYDISAEPKRPIQRQAVLASLDPEGELAPTGSRGAAAKEGEI